MRPDPAESAGRREANCGAAYEAKQTSSTPRKVGQSAEGGMGCPSRGTHRRRAEPTVFVGRFTGAGHALCFAARKEAPVKERGLFGVRRFEAGRIGRVMRCARKACARVQCDITKPKMTRLCRFASGPRRTKPRAEWAARTADSAGRSRRGARAWRRAAPRGRRGFCSMAGAGATRGARSHQALIQARESRLSDATVSRAAARPVPRDARACRRRSIRRGGVRPSRDRRPSRRGAAARA